jgi:hypothetical protein
MRLRVRDDGKSESHPVMEWIGVKPEDDITPRENGLTSIRSFVTRLVNLKVR